MGQEVSLDSPGRGAGGSQGLVLAPQDAAVHSPAQAAGWFVSGFPLSKPVYFCCSISNTVHVMGTFALCKVL